MDRLNVNGRVFEVVSEAAQGLHLELRDARTGVRAVLAWPDRAGWTLDRRPVRAMGPA